MDLPNFGEKDKLRLSAELLEYHSGDVSFSKEDFVKTVAPYIIDLAQHSRTNFLCAFEYGNGEKTDVTGYKTDITLNVTNNSRILKSKRTKGRWVVFKLNQ